MASSIFKWATFLLFLVGSGFCSVLETRQEKEPVTLEEILGGTFSASGFGGSWVPGSDDTLRVISGRTVVDYNVITGANATIVDSTWFDGRFGSAGLSLKFSPDNLYILIEHSRRNVWRHSYLAKYDVLEIATRTFVKVQPNGFEEADEQQELQLVVWSSSGHSVAFVYENNIHYKADPFATGQASQITEDGSDAVFNGISDWVYEEEMFGSPVAMWFSKDGGHLAFVKFNDSGVGFFQWPLYGEPGVPDTVYPTYEPIRYPKAGMDNPVVSIHLVDLSNPTTYRPVTFPTDLNPSVQYYIATVTWTSDTHMLLETLNRPQNQSGWSHCNAVDATCTLVYSQAQGNPSGWIDAHRPTVNAAGNQFLTLQPVNQPLPIGRSYNHIVRVSTEGVATTILTRGALHVDSILGWDEANNIIYFTGSGWNEASPNAPEPSERHIYSVTPTGTGQVCESCTLKTGQNEDCRSNTFSFSGDYTFYTHNCRGPGVPEITTKRTSDDSVVTIWVDNAQLRQRLEAKALPTVEHMEIDIPNGNGFTARVKLLLPPGFDSSKKYPLIVDVYGGPGSQDINQDYSTSWETYMVSSNKIIYANIDGRGSARQSLNLKYSVYRNLGTNEMLDQISVTKHLIDTLSYIDGSQTAIWGWSYGGYATGMVLGRDTNDVFKCGIAVAPVTSWLYYDTIYTERYMGTPWVEDNWSGYNESSVMNHLENFKKKEFLLIHGNADDNVHYQNSMMLARALEQADIMFEQLSYPEEAHSINGPGMRRHLYHSIERFLERNCFPGWEGWTEAEPNTDRHNGGPISSVVPTTMLVTISILVFVKHFIM